MMERPHSNTSSGSSASLSEEVISRLQSSSMNGEVMTKPSFKEAAKGDAVNETTSSVDRDVDIPSNEGDNPQHLHPQQFSQPSTPKIFDTDQWQQELEHELDQSTTSSHSHNPSSSTVQEQAPAESSSSYDSLKHQPKQHLLQQQRIPQQYQPAVNGGETIRDNAAHGGESDSGSNTPKHRNTKHQHEADDALQDTTTATMTQLTEIALSDPTKQSITMVKVRVWDPARPNEQVQFTTASQLLLGQGSNEVDSILFRSSNGTNESGVQRQLSSVEEEPELDESLRRDSNILGSKDEMIDAVGCGKDGDGSIAISDTVGENNAPVRSGDSQIKEGESKAMLQVGSIVGIQLNSLPSSSTYNSRQSHTSASVSSQTTVTTANNTEWKNGNSIHFHNVNLVPYTDVSTLLRKIESNDSSLRELVMDGLPLNAFSEVDAQVMIEAIGSNTSITRCSMRYSHVNDDMASHFALALVDNSTLTHLSLEGNALTDTSAKNFYSVLRTNNETLRSFDIGNNPLIDEDVVDALDEFMEQRALKRTLTLKGERAKRMARGLPLDDLEDEDGGVDSGLGGSVTVVCDPSVVNGTFHRSNLFNELPERSNRGNAITSAEAQDSSSAGTSLKPNPGESFKDYMQRIELIKMKTDTDQSSQSSSRDIVGSSDSKRVAFERSQQQQSPYPYHPQMHPLYYPPPYAQHPYLVNPSPTVHQFQNGGYPPMPPPTQRTNGNLPRQRVQSTNSSISSRSSPVTHNEGNIVSNTPADNGNQKASTVGYVAVTGVAAAAATTSSSSHPQIHESFQNEPVASREAQVSAESINSSHGSSSSKHPNFPNDRDYVDDKADEREIRRQLATSAGAIGAFHLSEPAPSRQNLAGGRRSRTRRTESQRRARLAVLTSGEGDGNAASDANESFTASGNVAVEAGNTVHSTNNGEVIMDAAIANVENGIDDPIKSSTISKLGFTDEERGTDRIIYLVIAIMAVVLLVLIIIYV